MKPDVANEVVPRPAATVLLLRDGSDGPEVFMMRRHGQIGAFPGAHVFPGGRVDVEDAADEKWCDGLAHAARQLPDLDSQVAVAFHLAAARELFEEAGVLLARDRTKQFVSLAGVADHERFKGYRQDIHAHRVGLRDVVEQEHLRLALDSLTQFAHWVTPPVEGRRFDTRFFATRVPPRQTPAHDDRETTESVWITPSAAIQASTRRAILLPPPTYVTLRELEPFPSVDAIIQWSETRTIERREPRFVQGSTTRMLVMPDDQTRFVWTDGYWRPEGID